ncbi:MAG: phosphate signaling complex protein PhoU [Chitinophagaceae bacterium]
MTNLEKELQNLKNAVAQMLNLVRKQLEKSSTAFLTMDHALAEEIIHTEKRVNAMELTIDKMCENIFALFNPVASDLRFTISMLKMNSDIERIGDYADGIADYVVANHKEFNKDMIEKTRISDMFSIAYHMLDLFIVSFENNNAVLPRTIFTSDRELNEINKASSSIIENLVFSDSKSVQEALYLFSTIKKVERIGDHIKNIAEDWIFYLDGEVLKHNK